MQYITGRDILLLLKVGSTINLSLKNNLNPNHIHEIFISPYCNAFVNALIICPSATANELPSGGS